MGPEWFYHYSILFWLVGALVTILVSAFSYKVYHLTRESKFFYFALAFGFMCLGYLSLSAMNLTLLTHISNWLSVIAYQFDFGFLAYIIFMLIGYTILAAVTLKFRTKKQALFLASLVMLFVLFSYQYFIKFHMVSFVLLAFPALQFYQNCIKNKSFNSSLVFASFYLLTIAQALFVLGTFYATVFITAHLLQLVGYLMLLWMFVRVIRHG